MLADLKFKGINIRYDILNDRLQCLHVTANGPVTIEVNPSFVRQFIYSDRTFIHFDLVHPGITVTDSGYYEVLASGRASLYIKWKKFVTTPSANHPGEYYQQKATYILLHDVMHRLTNRKSMLKAMDDRLIEIKSYIRQHRISARHSSDPELTAIVNYYNSLF